MIAYSTNKISNNDPDFLWESHIWNRYLIEKSRVQSDHLRREKVTVTFVPRYGAKVYRTMADPNDGSFEIQLDPNNSRKRYLVKVSGSEGGPPAVAKNVMFGDVFFCSGQSNVDFPVKVSYNSTMEMQSLKV